MDSDIILSNLDLVNCDLNHMEYLDVRAKLTPLKDGAKFYYALFSESGFDEKIIAESKTESDLQLYDLGQIVNYR